jgi:hypothetical protein
VTEVTARAAHHRYHGMRPLVPVGLAVVRVAMDFQPQVIENRIQPPAKAIMMFVRS